MIDIPEILLIEDSEDDSNLFKRAVEMSGLRANVTLAADAAQAVSRLNRLGKFSGLPLPDLIVLDLDLPWLQGITILQIIRNAYAKESIPVVILTGLEDLSKRTACRELGISDFLRKPNSLEDLIALVSTLARFIPNQPSHLHETWQKNRKNDPATTSTHVQDHPRLGESIRAPAPSQGTITIHRLIIGTPGRSLDTKKYLISEIAFSLHDGQAHRGTCVIGIIQQHGLPYDSSPIEFEAIRPLLLGSSVNLEWLHREIELYYRRQMVAILKHFGGEGTHLLTISEFVSANEWIIHFPSTGKWNNSIVNS